MLILLVTKEDKVISFHNYKSSKMAFLMKDAYRKKGYNAQVYKLIRR